MNKKIALTKYIINELNLISKSEKHFKSWIHTIWQNPRFKNKGGLRLTKKGFELFFKSNIKYFEIKSEEYNLIQDNKFILWLDHHFDFPFYIATQKIFVFDEHTAVQLVLFSGNIQNYYKAHKSFIKNKL